MGETKVYQFIEADKTYLRTIWTRIVGQSLMQAVRSAPRTTSILAVRLRMTRRPYFEHPARMAYIAKKSELLYSGQRIK